MEKAEAKQNTQPAVIYEKSEQQGGLRPLEKISQLQQIALIKVRKINVVNMDYDARSQPRQDFQIQENDIAARFDGVRRIDEEQIARFKLTKELWVHSLYRLLDKFDALAPHSAQKLAGMGFNARQSSEVTFAFIALECA